MISHKLSSCNILCISVIPIFCNRSFNFQSPYTNNTVSSDSLSWVHFGPFFPRFFRMSQLSHIPWRHIFIFFNNRVDQHLMAMLKNIFLIILWFHHKRPGIYIKMKRKILPFFIGYILRAISLIFLINTFYYRTMSPVYNGFFITGYFILFNKSYLNKVKQLLSF